eukprot:scaffold159272_cov36-Tisochrysis_lutea.AAC.1
MKAWCNEQLSAQQCPRYRATKLAKLAATATSMCGIPLSIKLEAYVAHMRSATCRLGAPRTESGYSAWIPSLPRSLTPHGTGGTANLFLGGLVHSGARGALWWPHGCHRDVRLLSTLRKALAFDNKCLREGDCD